MITLKFKDIHWILFSNLGVINYDKKEIQMLARNRLKTCVGASSQISTTLVTTQILYSAVFTVILWNRYIHTFAKVNDLFSSLTYQPTCITKSINCITSVIQLTAEYLVHCRRNSIMPSHWSHLFKTYLAPWYLGILENYRNSWVQVPILQTIMPQLSKIVW